MSSFILLLIVVLVIGFLERLNRNAQVDDEFTRLRELLVRSCGLQTQLVFAAGNPSRGSCVRGQLCQLLLGPPSDQDINSLYLLKLQVYLLTLQVNPDRYPPG